MTTIEHPYVALMKALHNRLLNGGNWGTQVSEVIQPAWVKPYCMMYYISGGEGNLLLARNVQFEIGVKVVAETQQQSLSGAAQVIALLDDQGEQDQPTTALDGGNDWQISTVTAGRMIHLIEAFENAQNIYHDGNVFQVVMGRTA